jgi:hypothetical protein
VAGRCKATFQTKKLKRPLDREYNTAVYFLRCKQTGFSLRELFDLDYGEVCDVMIEAANDHAQYNYKATQSDFDNAFKL